jgi:hypothetical protein
MHRVGRVVLGWPTHWPDSRSPHSADGGAAGRWPVALQHPLVTKSQLADYCNRPMRRPALLTVFERLTRTATLPYDAPYLCLRPTSVNDLCTWHGTKRAQSQRGR